MTIPTPTSRARSGRAAPLAALLPALLIAWVAGPARADRLVNMVPKARSGETSQDAEPTLAIDPSNVAHMAGAAFTWDNLTGAPMATATAPIYVSSDRGQSWTMAMIVPSQSGSPFPTGDITLSFSATASGATAHSSSWLYGGILSAVSAGLPMTVLRSQDPFSTAGMTVLDGRSGNVDQPHTTARTSGGQDRLYVGFNNGFACIAPSGRSSTVDVSQDAAIATPVFTLDVIDGRNSACQDGFAQVVAVHPDGTVYAAFLHDWTGVLRLVVVRDDGLAAGTAPLQALTDPSDGAAGRFVTGAITPARGSLGQNRLGGSNVSIAVDPTSSDRVYVAWGDGNGSGSEAIHLRRSVNRGVDWSADLVTAGNALNPEVAIDSTGVVGLLYQQLNSGNWETILVRSHDLDASTFDSGLLLASQDATKPAAMYSPYIGDYASLVSAGGVFFGMFSASNYPDKSRFMTGVSYQREVDWTTHTLFADAAHTMVVAASIDPFFFEVQNTVCQKTPFFCNLCVQAPWLCYVAYDPWWWLKCPQCGIHILVDPGDPIEQLGPIAVYDSRGKRVGGLRRLETPVVEAGTTYRYEAVVKVEKGVGYLLKVEVPAGQKVPPSFHPKTFVQLPKTATPR
jgi:hypothetical protein